MVGVEVQSHPAPVTTDSLALRLKRAEHAVRQQLAPVLAEYGLSLEHWRIIAVLREHPGLPMSALAEQAVVPAASLTRYVDTLVQLGMVIRRIDPHDRRRTAAALAARGSALADRLRAAELTAEEAVAANLGRRPRPRSLPR